MGERPEAGVLISFTETQPKAMGKEASPSVLSTTLHIFLELTAELVLDVSLCGAVRANEEEQPGSRVLEAIICVDNGC